MNPGRARRVLVHLPTGKRSRDQTDVQTDNIPRGGRRDWTDVQTASPTHRDRTDVRTGVPLDRMTAASLGGPLDGPSQLQYSH